MRFTDLVIKKSVLSFASFALLLAVAFPPTPFVAKVWAQARTTSSAHWSPSKTASSKTASSKIASAQASSSPTPQPPRPDIDEIAMQALAATGVPSAQVAIVEKGQLTYVQAYGQARLDPPLAARTDMRYSIGSISKQFTAAAILLLQEEHKLTLDDKVEKFVPGLTRGNEVTVRQLLSHTSGYQDYWPQDYVPAFMMTTVNSQKILDMWAHKPLDFDPGTKWQYSNTNFVIAGLIVEKASGMPFLDFLRQRIFRPLHMQSVADIDQNTLTVTDATGYFRYAMGPARVAPKEGKGWLFAAAELSMTAEDLQKWNVALIEKKLLKPESYKELESEVRLKDGSSTGYALGIGVRTQYGHRVLRHGGEVSGFTATSVVLPDDGVAVVVLTNQDAIDASGKIAQSIVSKLVPMAPPADPQHDEQIWKILEGLTKGEIDRTLFSANGTAYFSDLALKDYATSLGALGKLESLGLMNTGNRGGMTYWNYVARFTSKTVGISVYALADGKIEQFIVAAQE